MRKIWIAAVLLILLFYVLPLSSFADDYHGIKILGEYPLPDDFSISVSDECSGHDSFDHVSAREDGWFAVCSTYTNPEGDREKIFNVHYVDIYDDEGRFIQELSYSTGFNHAIELTDNSLNIYFDIFIISYNLESRKIQSYSIPRGSIYDNGLIYELQSKHFTSGEWEYESSGGSFFHTKLTRSNGVEKQVLLDYSSINYFNSWFRTWCLHTIFYASVIGAVFLYASKVKKR